MSGWGNLVANFFVGPLEWRLLAGAPDGAVFALALRRWRSLPLEWRLLAGAPDGAVFALALRR